MTTSHTPMRAGRVTPEDDDATGPASNGGTKDRDSEQQDSAIDDGHRKAFLTLQARAALLGFELIELGCNTYLLARWGVSRELPDLRAVGDLLRRIGGAA